jgi:hypothetical protein
MVDSDARSTEQPGAGDGGGGAPEEIPLGQRLLENWVVLLVACLVIFFVFYGGWGTVEMMSLPDAPLP